MSEAMVANLVYIEDTNPDPTLVEKGYWWTGKGTLVFEGQEWQGALSDKGSLFDFSEVVYTPTIPDKRTTFDLAIGKESAQRLMSVDLGAVQVELGWIFSKDEGATWTRLPRRFVGRLGRTVVNVAEGLFSGEVETYLGDIDRGRPKTWSDETQRNRHSGLVTLYGAENAASTNANAVPKGGSHAFGLSGTMLDFDRIEIHTRYTPVRNGETGSPTQLTYIGYPPHYTGGFELVFSTAATGITFVPSDDGTSIEIFNASATDDTHLLWIAGSKPDIAFRQARDLARGPTNRRWPPFNDD